MKQPQPTNERDSKGRRLWDKWCTGCDKHTRTRFEHVGKLCLSCAKSEFKGFPAGTLVDSEFLHLEKWSWRVINSGYIYHTVHGLLHRYVMQAPPHLEVNHKNKNKLDCRRENLELVTPLQNARHKLGKPMQTPTDVNFF